MYQRTTPASSSYQTTEDAVLASKRQLLQKGLKSHLKDMYPSEESAASVYSKDGSISVNISAEKINLRNFWSGRMSSVWTADVQPTTVRIAGDIKVSTGRNYKSHESKIIVNTWHPLFHALTVYDFIIRSRPSHRFTLTTSRTAMCSCSPHGHSPQRTSLTLQMLIFALS